MARLCICGEPTATPRSQRCKEHATYRALSKAGRVPTAAAAVQQCPRCGGPLAHDGVVVACRRRIACGWVELVSRAVRAGGAS